MRVSAGTGSLRTALLGVVVVLSVVCGIGVASAATDSGGVRPAAGKANAPRGAVRQLGLVAPLSG